MPLLLRRGNQIQLLGILIKLRSSNTELEEDFKQANLPLLLALEFHTHPLRPPVI